MSSIILIAAWTVVTMVCSVHCIDSVIRTGECQTISNASFCSYLWNNTYLPNVREHSTQEEVMNELDDFLPAITTLQCSNAVVHFLCSVYMPHCSSTGIMAGEIIVISPCREVCEYVRMGCEPLLAMYGFPWPDHLMCENFPLKQPCFNISDFSSVRILPNLLPPQPTTSASHALTTTMKHTMEQQHTPSTATFSSSSSTTATHNVRSTTATTITTTTTTTMQRFYNYSSAATYTHIKDNNTSGLPTTLSHLLLANSTIITGTLTTTTTTTAAQYAIVSSSTTEVASQATRQQHYVTTKVSSAMVDEFADMMTVSVSVFDDDVYWQSDSANFMKSHTHSASSSSSMTRRLLIPTTTTTATPPARETNSARSTLSYGLTLGVFVLIGVLIV